MNNMDKNEIQDQQMNVGLNPQHIPILYTDMVFMNVNEDGVTFDICQKVGTTNQFQVISRIGMSREHAKRFVTKLSEILALTMGHSQSGEKEKN